MQAKRRTADVEVVAELARSECAENTVLMKELEDGGHVLESQLEFSI